MARALREWLGLAALIPPVVAALMIAVTIELGTTVATAVDLIVGDCCWAACRQSGEDA